MSAAESKLAQVERHVVEGEQRVARQRAIIQRLERDKHLAAAARARETLKALEVTLAIMRQHLHKERRIAVLEALP